MHDCCISNCSIIGEPVPLRLQLRALQRGQGVRSEVRIEQLDELDKLGVSIGISDGAEGRKEEGANGGCRLGTRGEDMNYGWHISRRRAGGGGLPHVLKAWVRPGIRYRNDFEFRYKVE